MSTTKFPKLSLRIASLCFAAVQACSSNSTGDGASALPIGSKPVDSSGSVVAVSMQMSTELDSSTLNIAESGLDLGNGLVLTYARVNIAKIKIKPNREEDEDEKELNDEVESRSHGNEESQAIKSSHIDTEKLTLLKKYKELFAAANTPEEKAAVREAFASEKKVLEAESADLKKADEDAGDALESEKDGDLKWKGPYVYDLVRNAISPELPSTEVFDGTYHRIQFQLKADRVATDALLNNSIYIKGTTTISGKATEFTFAMGSSENLRLMSNEGITVNSDGKNVFTIAFQPGKWFENVDFSQAEVNDLGLLVIDNESNKDLFQEIRHNIKASTHCGKNHDHGGRVEDDEGQVDGQEDADEDYEAEVSGKDAGHSRK